MNYQLIYWSVGGLLALLAIVSLYYYSCHCSPPHIE